MVSINSKNENLQVNEINNKNIPQKFYYKREKVAIVKLDDYQSKNVHNALKKIINLLEINTYFKEKSILLKPNALAPSKNAFTPPEMIKELIKIIKDDANAKEIFVGDSTMTKTLTSITFKRSKIKKICEEEGVKLINFFESERIKVKLNHPDYDIEENIYLPKEIHDVDLVINIPKLKTHNGYVYTGAIKNLFGLLGNKMNMHMTHKNKIEFQQMLADIYFAVEETNKTEFPKVLTVMDACIAMEGKGPRSGKPRKVGLLIAGFNPAAVDIVGYTLMNGNPKDLEAIYSLAKRTELPMDISQLEIVGNANYKDFIVRDFKKPKIAILKNVQVRKGKFYSKIIEKMTRISIKIKRKKCILCEECVSHCPAKALVRKNDRIIVDREKCIECFCCGESCPNNAINAKIYLFRVLPLIILLMSLGAITFIWLLFSIISNFL
jgi:uncharacterized protein (DUF362 family)/NAD-dependent dihydropyrimidine dehydrogenase PreA subunit